MESRYRACVLAVFTNADGRVLVAERSDGTGAWQFPQGGVEAGELAETALFREMEEELGTRAFDVVERAAGSVRYQFPPDMRSQIAKEFCGQDQVWFHTRFHDGAAPDLTKASDQEFHAVRWVTPQEALTLAVANKKDAYKRGLAALRLVDGNSNDGES